MTTVQTIDSTTTLNQAVKDRLTADAMARTNDTALAFDRQHLGKMDTLVQQMIDNPVAFDELPGHQREHIVRYHTWRTQGPGKNLPHTVGVDYPGAEA